MARVRQSTDASTINLDDIADSTFYGSISSWASIMEEAEKSEPESRTAMLEIAQARIDANRKFIRSLIDKRGKRPAQGARRRVCSLPAWWLSVWRSPG